MKLIKNIAAALLAVCMIVGAVPAGVIFEPVAAVAATPDAPELYYAVNYSTGVALKWSKVEGAKKYEVWVKPDGMSWTKYKTLKDNSWVFYDVINHKKFSFKIVAVSGAKRSDASDVMSCMYVAPSAINSVVSPAKKELRVTYAKAQGASGYEVQVSSDKSFNKVLDQKNNKHSTPEPAVFGATSGSKLYVRVRATYKKDGKTYYSAWKVSSRAVTVR